MTTGFGVSASPVGGGPRRTSGLLLRLLTEGPADDDRSRGRAREFQRLTTYATQNFRRFGYVPLCYFTELGFQAADKD